MSVVPLKKQDVEIVCICGKHQMDKRCIDEFRMTMDTIKEAFERGQKKKVLAVKKEILSHSKCDEYHILNGAKATCLDVAYLCVDKFFGGDKEKDCGFCKGGVVHLKNQEKYPCPECQRQFKEEKG